MLISDFAIRKPVVTVTAMVALVVFGLLALVNLQTDEYPDVQAPIIGITIVYPGASPAVVEREIINPIEERLFTISGIDGPKTTANAVDSLAQFTVFFHHDKNVQQASQDIRDAISAVRADLPAEMKEPILTRFDPSDEPIVSLTLTSASLSSAALTRIADPTVIREIRSVPGVAQATVVGGVKPEMTVQIRPQALQAAGISVPELVGALQAQNLAAPVGRINAAFDERTIRLKGRLETPEDFAAVPVAQRGGRAIRLGEVADVFVGAEEARTLALYDSREAVGIEILKAKGASTTRVAGQIREKVKELQARLPAGAKLEVVRDAGVRVASAVRNTQWALVEGAALTVLVVFLFLNSWRSTVITGLALPISVLAGFVSVWLFGFTLNTMSLLGLTLAIGILIDDAIVVRENIVRHIEMGKDHFTASREGTAQIGLAVTATTLSIVAVFVPVAFMPGVAGQWFKPFGLTMACAVLVSLFVSFSLDPMLSAYWADPQTEAHERRNPIARAVDRFNRWFDRQADNYTRVVGWALDHRWLMTLVIAPGTMVLALWLQATFGGSQFVPNSDRGEISISVETPPGSNLAYTRRKVEETVRRVKARPEVAYTYATLGTPLPLRTPGVDQAVIYVRLVPREQRKLSQVQLGAELRRELASLGGASVAVFTSGFGGAFKQIALELRAPSGSDPLRLVEHAEKISAAVKKVPGAADVGLSTRGQAPELVVELDRPLAGSLGITAGQVASSLRPAFAGVDAGDWVDPTGETRDVTLRLSPEARERASDLAALPLVVQGADGRPAMLPLGQVARVQQGVGPAQIDHLNRDLVVNVQANTDGRPLSEVMSGIWKALAPIPMPPGYKLTEGGEARDQDEVFTQMFTALAVAVLLMYLILVVQFGSFLDPIAILVSLPLSLIGVVVALILTGDTLNIMSMIGLMLLAGIVAKNAILLVDFAKWARERGTPLREALIEAGRVRLRPILMTTFALIAGMVPVALGLDEGGDFNAPMGRAVIGGTITSTILTLVMIPTVYEILDGGKQWILGLLRRVFGGSPGAGHGSPGAGHGAPGAPSPVPQQRKEP
ncbi:MAG: efflux RND transporter permease subunit [Deltaproteobacteria bacterium]|nr:efflux RND transporter permease subunit [Deltaproteobacteria bacterium]